MKAVRLAIKVDVDTLVGTREGIPRLRDLFDRRGVKASFYLSLGPDNSGRAIFRVFTRPGFLAKQLRNKAPSAYGFKTMLYGTLLPAPVIGRGIEKLVAGLAEAGHEVGLHAWDHVAWHDQLWKWTENEVAAEVNRGLEAFRKLTGRLPLGFAAPAWRLNLAAARAFKQAGLKYTAATRGAKPFFPRFDGREVGLLEIPTTLPTADEILGTGGVTPENLDRYFLEKTKDPGTHVLTIHAEQEGRGLASAFERLLGGWLDRGVAFLRLADLASECSARPEETPWSDVIKLEIPGRPGAVSHQAA